MSRPCIVALKARFQACALTWRHAAAPLPDTYNPAPGVMEGVPSSRGYKGGFASRLMVKDLGLAMQAAQHYQAPTPMAERAQR